MLNTTEIIHKRDQIIQKYGPWWDNFQLAPGVWTRQEDDTPNPRLIKLTQLIIDLAPKPISECRILDLGCANGHFALELGFQGANVTGIEGREASVQRANFAKQVMELSQVSFAQDDVRNISTEKYGVFDIVLCSGLLYHLAAEDIGPLIETMYSMSEYMTIIDTHIGLSADTTITFQGHTYSGTLFREHYHHDTETIKEARERASLDNKYSFWPTRPSIINMLTHAGYSSTYECFTPPFPGTNDRVTLCAVKRKPVQTKTFPTTPNLPDCQEGDLAYSPKSPTIKKIKWMSIDFLDKSGLLPIVRRVRNKLFGK